ncbi:hypothetical protein NMG60_11004851 [Bertholletia excelsa]
MCRCRENEGRRNRELPDGREEVEGDGSYGSWAPGPAAVDYATTSIVSHRAFLSVRFSSFACLYNTIHPCFTPLRFQLLRCRRYFDSFIAIVESMLTIQNTSIGFTGGWKEDSLV